jgi:hypothetical protein
VAIIEAAISVAPMIMAKGVPRCFATMVQHQLNRNKMRSIFPHLRGYPPLTLHFHSMFQTIRKTMVGGDVVYGCSPAHILFGWQLR